MRHIGPSYVSLELCRASHARLVAPSRAIASGDATYTLRRHAADGVPHFAPNLWWPQYEDTMRVYLDAFPAAQVARSLGLDLPIMSVHGAGAYDATTSSACKQTQHPPFHAACVRLGSAAYPL